MKEVSCLLSKAITAKNVIKFKEWHWARQSAENTNCINQSNFAFTYSEYTIAIFVHKCF